jgi:uncharacterized protein
MSAFGYRRPADLPQTLALFPLQGAVLYPRGVLTLNVFEPRYLNMVDDALASERLIGIIQPAVGEENEPVPQLADVGTAGRITSFTEAEDGRYLITLTGICRFHLGGELDTGLPYRQALVTFDDFAADFALSNDMSIDRAQLMRSLKTYADLHGFNVDWSSVDNVSTETLVNSAAQMCPFDPAAKQALLEAFTLDERTKGLVALLEWDNASDNQRGSLQ